ncbi:MAG: hypothetical protein ACR2P3_07515 [Geminicoccaceae bacterium]
MIKLNAIKDYELFGGDIKIQLKPWHMDLALEADAYAADEAAKVDERWRNYRRRVATYSYLFAELLHDWEGVSDLDAEGQDVKADPNRDNAFELIKQVPDAFAEVARVIDDHASIWIDEKKDSKASSSGRQKGAGATAERAPKAKPPAREANGALTVSSAPTSNTA